MIRRSFDRQSIAHLVAAQGVDRPFRILLRMPEANRIALANLLDCDVVAGEPAELQSWRLINQNLRGLQARTHRLHETLSPFARNNNWWEIVTRTAQRLGLRFQAGMKDEEVERLLFDHLAAEFVRTHVRKEDDPDQFLAELHPNLSRAIASLGLSHTGKQMLVATLLRAAAFDADGGGDPREGHNRLSDWLRRTMPWTWTTSISLGLRLLQQRLGDIHVAIAGGTRARRIHSSPVLPLAPHPRAPWRGLLRNYEKVGTALMVIHLHDVVERALEQFDIVGG